MSLIERSAGTQPAHASGRALLRLTAGLVHTVNNALTGTVGYLELALRQSPAGSKLSRDLQAALACVYRAAEAVRQVVTFAHMPAHVRAQPLSLREVAVEAARNASGCAWERVNIICAGDRQARTTGQPALLAAAVEQVVRNALEAMPDGGRLTIETEESAGRSRLWIRDNGPGLPVEVQEHLFEPFVTTKAFPHLGLGLVVASELVRAQDGVLTLSSCPGLGTTVLFTFPMLGTDDADVRPVARRPEYPSLALPEWRSPRPVPSGNAV
jgi:two-component system, sporulation sensor kinase B